MVTNDLDWQTEPVGKEDLRLVGASVLRVALGIERLVGSIKSSTPGEGSRAMLDLASPVDRASSDGLTHLAHAQGAMTTACLAGADHMRAFVIGVRSKRTTVSNWTLARGALEAFSRSKYLIDAEDASELLGRSFALARKEMHFAQQFGSITTRGEGPLDVQGYLDGITEVLADVGVTALKAPGATVLTADLIEDAAPGSGGRHRYSQLSAAAHGESAGVQMFMNPDLGTLSLSRVLVLEAAHMQLSAAIAVGDRVLKYFAPNDSGAADRWDIARTIALLSTWQHAGATIDEHGRPTFPKDRA